MKLQLVLFACCIAVSSAGHPCPERPKILSKNTQCDGDSDCPRGCCESFGVTKKCVKLLKYKEGCTTRHHLKMRCVCGAGLQCVKAGLVKRECRAIGNQDGKANQMCTADKECKNGCCLGIGIFKFCKEFSKEGDTCTISSKIGCGCAPGLECLKVGVLKKICANNTRDCGKPEIQGVRVIGGKTAVRGSWPWQILLNYLGNPGCGGTLIGPEWVITAAHCVYGLEAFPSRLWITIGEHDRSKKEGSELNILVGKIFRHPQYSPYTLENDIALLKLNRPVIFNKYASPACLPTVDPPVGSSCYITGWGKTRHPGTMTTILQQGKLSVVSNKVCNAKNERAIGIKVTDSMICGGDGGKSKLSGCHGDSGGPFVCNINGRWEIHGAVSHGPGNCNSTVAYSVFSRVNHFKKWILDTIRQK